MGLPNVRIYDTLGLKNQMPRKRAHVLLPDDLLTDIDAFVGPRQRSAFLVEVLREEVNRRRLLKMLSGPEPLLNQAEYPEFKNGSEAWVRQHRDEDLRLEREKLGPWLGSISNEE